MSKKNFLQQAAVKAYCQTFRKKPDNEKNLMRAMIEGDYPNETYRTLQRWKEARSLFLHYVDNSY